MESSKPDITPKARAEASAWIARLHGPARDARLEAGFRAWLHANPAHARAFEHITEAWEAVGSVPRERLSSMVRWDRVGTGRRRIGRAMFAAAATLALVLAGALAHLSLAPVVTEIGEQRTVTLEDGSRVYLNTASRLRVKYDRHMRRVELDEGEALFEIASRPGWPFVVTAGDREITALGTSFVVRRDGNRVAVTLVEGKVAVEPARVSRATDNPVASLDRAQSLAPGQRLTFIRGQRPTLDQPVLARVTAWQRGLVVLDNTPLVDAIAELNRYSTVSLEITDPRATQLRVSGAFRTGDSLSFARAIAETYQLEVQERYQRIVLSRQADPSYP